LYQIQKYFNGTIFKDPQGRFAHLTIVKLEGLNVIISHLIKYPLQSSKIIDFQLWQKCVSIMENKGHLVKEGLSEIVSLKSAINWGLSEKIAQNFSSVKG
jgi:hypothetical protein